MASAILDQHGNPYPTRVQREWQGLRAEVAKLRARYDAAETNDDNRRHWALADGMSVNALNSPGRRRTLRNRARYETACNSYARGISLTLANDTIGTGPRLQMQLAGRADANRLVERRFLQWARAVRLAEKLRLMRLARFDTGESFAVLTTNPRLPTPVQLDLTVIEADQCTTPDLIQETPTATDGIRYDQWGNPVEYHFLRHHPGDLWANPLDYVRWPAAQVIHYYRADRPGQRRGIPDITPCLPLFAQLRRYTLAVLAASETAADLAGVIRSNIPPEQAAELEPMDTIDIVQRMLLTLPQGWDITQLKAEQPATTYEMFARMILNEILRCICMPYNIGAGNSSSYNYASGRLDHQTYFKSIRVERHQIELTAIERIFWAWLDEAALIEGFLPPGLPPFIDWEHSWYWDGFEHVDPLKEANAEGVRLANHTDTLARIYAMQGRDWEEELRQRARELDLMRELGLPLVGASADTAGDDEPASEDTDDDEAVAAAGGNHAMA